MPASMTKRTLSLAALALAAGLYGCNRTPDAGEKAGAPAAAQKPLDILIDWQNEPTYLGVYYAKQKGYFAKLGYDAKITQSWGAVEAATAVAGGKYLIGTSSGGATVLGRNNGAKLVSTAVLYQRVPSVVYGLSSSGITKPADLKGKRVGIYPGGTTVNEFDAFAKLNGLKKSDMTIVSLNGADIPLLLAKKVDGVLHYTEMSPVQVETNPEIPGTPPKTYELKLADHGVAGYGLNIIVSEDSWKTRGPELKVLTDAMLQGYRDGCANKTDAVDTFVKEFPDKSRAYVAASWDKVCALVGATPGAQDEAGWQKTIDLYRGLGLLKTDVKPGDIMAK